MTEADRSLEWEGCRNVRDLGGLPTVGGGRTRWGSFVRADLLGRLTEQGRRQLLDYGVRTIVDLRMPHEVAADPPAVFTDGQDAPTYLNLNAVEDKPEVRARLKAAQTRVDKYTISLDGFPEANARIMRAMATAEPGGVVFHCHSGKDRTGVVAALLLDLAGVEEEAIVGDYAISQERLMPLYEKWLEETGGEEAIDPWWIPITEPQTMRGVLAHLRTHYGGAEGYLRQAGLGVEAIARIREKLV
jgi:protein-tyrosine phosphatase